MISAKIDNKTRKSIYRRDGYRCALCDSTDGLQIHHVVLRSQGGTDYPHNLIALCWRCHAAAHGTRAPGYDDIQPAQVTQSCVEYLADFYANEGYLWNPWSKNQIRLFEENPSADDMMEAAMIGIRVGKIMEGDESGG